MTLAALATLIIAWSIIGFFTVRFFIKVLRTPQEKDR